ncbi:Myrosinase 1 [Blattella germanica]|nr:Myrosinase 1 [Blattella germanica]
MATLRLFCFVLIASVQGISIPDVGNSKAYEFPEDFMFGVATAAYQIEGGFNEDGRGPSIWDTLTHERNYLISDHSTGDVACDSYHKYKDDIQLMKDLGVQFYRFSFSWSRILPDGHANLINQAGIDYYNNVINELLSNNIQPMATIYHWDLPQVLQDLGGWPNPVIADYYLDYARILFENFGDRVKYWITFNEAKTFTEGYESDSGHAPALDAAGYGKYLSAHTVVRAHAKAYHLYDEEFRPTQQGKVGITLDSYWCEVYENSTAYIDACDRKLEFSLGIFANPIYSEGDFTAVVKDRVAAISASQGFSTSRLPALTQEDIEYIRGNSCNIN